MAHGYWLVGAGAKNDWLVERLARIMKKRKAEYSVTKYDVAKYNVAKYNVAKYDVAKYDVDCAYRL